MRNPFFSICIPNFNYSKYLKLTIESVLQQSFQDFEIIVSDNASTDDSVAMVKSFNDSRITIVENSINLGFTPNLDKCTEIACGRYMILLSSDDTMLPNALDTYYKIIERNQGSLLVLMSACSVIDSHGNRINGKKAMTGDVSQYLQRNSIKPFHSDHETKADFFHAKDILRGLLLGTFQPAGQFLATCYPSELFKKLDGYRSIMAVHPDAQFSHRLLFLNPVVCYLHQELFGYRVHLQNNNAATVSMANIKYLTDSYILSKQYDKAQLQSIDMKPEDLENAFINHLIFRDAFWSLARGRAMKGIRLLSFGIAAYPNKVIWNIKFLGLFLMVFTTPVLSFLFSIKKIIKNHT
jgi:glycosyltransferase involved in cell wall biosynthesis